MTNKIDDDGAAIGPTPARDPLSTDGLRLAYAREVSEGDGKTAPETSDILAIMGSLNRLNLFKPDPGRCWPIGFWLRTAMA